MPAPHPVEVAAGGFAEQEAGGQLSAANEARGHGGEFGLVLIHGLAVSVMMIGKFCMILKSSPSSPPFVPNSLKPYTF